MADHPGRRSAAGSRCRVANQLRRFFKSTARLQQVEVFNRLNGITSN